MNSINKYTVTMNVLTIPRENEEDDVWRASLRGDTQMVGYYVESLKSATAFAKYDINTLSQYGRSALYQAALGGHEDTVRWLISQGASDFDGTAYIACSDPNTRLTLRKAGFNGKGTFNDIIEVKKMKSERKLVLALGMMNHRVCNENMSYLDYDIICKLIENIEITFKDTRKYRNTFKRWNKQKGK